MHSPRKPIRGKLYIDLQLADGGQSIYPLQSYMPAGQVHAGSKMGPTGYDNSQYCGEVFPFCSLKKCKIHYSDSDTRYVQS